MKTTHTPGPWFVIDAGTANDHRDSRICDEAGHVLAVVRGRDVPDSIHIGNCNVMAASPKLLRALRQIIAVCPECDGCGIADHAGMVPCPWCETARAAVASAERGVA